MDLMKIFKRKIKILELDYHQLNSEDYITKLNKNCFDGIIIRNLLSNEEVIEILSTIDNIEDNFDIPHRGAKVYPSPCSSTKYNNNFDKFYIDTHTYIENYPKIFKVDIIERSITLMKKISLKKVTIAKTADKYYLPGTFRVISSEKTEIGLTQVHIGHQYAKKCIEDGSYKDLIEKIDVLKQFSFFTVIQEPNSGGDFTVFNFDYKYYNSVTDEIITNWKTKKEKSVYSKNRFRTINLQSGDAFIFRDYDTWHRVEPVNGDKDRITYGFWFGYDENKDIKIWS